MSLRGYIWTALLLIDLAAWYAIIKGVAQLCEMACAVGKYGW